MGWLWFIITVIIFAISMYALGRWDTNTDKIGLVPVIFVLSAAWPFLLAIATVLGPFAGLYFLGEYVREKKTNQ